ncbi:hypothetical protein RA2_04356 [Roseovarius sp. A-2]|uniref:hypothetical protein n=1 Tax=Roseovarius sp. A-2 TaxID=1570360 RepID=UPI0009B52CBC|nr:hypothetical protein [Roseovarius sp. A-2]GAW37279.1 hypothetical protein RA2_04356 [Roseovarius sp. A-2]
MTKAHPETAGLTPIVPATALFRGLAPTYARELSGYLHRIGVVNSSDAIRALLIGLEQFSAERNVSLTAVYPVAWPEALQYLCDARSEEEWAILLSQTPAAPQAAAHKISRGASQMVQSLDASCDSTGMSPRIAVLLGIWVLTAVVIAHSGPVDADITLKDLAKS